MSKKPRKVVITGVGLGTPAGYGLAENLEACRVGKHQFTEITAFNTKGSSVKYAGQCPDPDVKRLPDRKVQKILRRKDVISLLATLDAAKDAGIEKGKIDPERFGMYCGAPATQIGDLTPYFTLVAQCADLETGTFDTKLFGQKLMDLVNPLVVLQTLMNNGLCFGAMTLDIRGVNSNFMDFQVAGLRAVGEGFRSIAHDRADIVIAGGISGPIEPFQLAQGVQNGYLATTKNVEASDEGLGKLVRPWDKSRLGSILSEGSAYVVLEEEGHALRRGAKIMGRVEGFFLASDGIFDFMAETDSPGLSRAIQGALDECGLKKEDLGMLMGHGNGSRHADMAEAKAYADYLGAFGAKLPLSSSKAVVGDLCEAGAVYGMILALDAIQRGEVPPTFNFTAGEGPAARLSIKAEPQKILAPRAAITARNFLGLCASVIVTAA